MSVVRFRPWAPTKLGNIYINQLFTEFLLYLLPNFLPKNWDDSGLFIQERFAPVRLVRTVQLVCLRTIEGGGLTAVVMVMVATQKY